MNRADGAVAEVAEPLCYKRAVRGSVKPEKEAASTRVGERNELW